MEKGRYKRTIVEVFGDLLATPGKRFLTSVLMAAICYFLGMVMGWFSIGFILFIYVAISFIDKTKTFYVKSLFVQTQGGETVPCIMVKQKCYATSVFPFSLFCPFNYVPYRTRFYLIKNVESSDMAEGTRISDEFISKGIVHVEEMPKRYAKAIMKNPQLLEEALSGKTYDYRNQFLQDIKPFAEEGFLEELFYNSQFSICEIQNVGCLLFSYAGHGGVQRGIGIKKDSIEEIKSKPAIVWDIYASEELSVGALTTTVLERLMVRKNGTSNTSGYISEAIDKNKLELNEELIKEKVRPKNRRKIFAGIMWCYLSLGGFGAMIAGFVSGIFPTVIAGLLIGVFFVRLGVRAFKKHGESKRNYSLGNYKILAVKCISTVDSQEEEFYRRIHRFANGTEYSSPDRFAIEGDLCYLVYPEGEERPSAYYNSTVYKPAAELKIEYYE